MPTAKKKKRRRPSSEQSLASGKKLLADNYVHMLGGFRDRKMTVDPCSALMLFAGRTGMGKSTFLQSCPWAFIINADLSSTPRTPKAIIWPGVRSDGVPVEVNPDADDPSDPEQGVPFELTWEAIREKADMLVRMAKENVPNRPRIVALDTTDFAFPLVQEYLLREWNDKHPDNTKDEFNDLDGRQAWPRARAEIRDLGMRLHRVGYGFCWVFHLGDKMVYLSENKKEYLENHPRTQENLWNEVVGQCELVAAVDKRRESRQQRVALKNRDGTPKLHSKTNQPLFKRKDVEVEVCRLSFEPGAVMAEGKSRYDGIGASVILDKSDPWGSFEKAIRVAMAQEEV